MNVIFEASGAIGEQPPLRLLADRERFVVADRSDHIIEGRRSPWRVDITFHTPSQRHAVVPITSNEARRRAAMNTFERSHSWLHHFRRALLSSPWSPLHTGQWRLEMLPSMHSLDDRVRARRTAQVMVPFGVAVSRPFDSSLPPFYLPLRHWPGASDGRVKALRKFAKEAIPLPPVLMWWVDPLESYIVLDGHARMAAAALDLRALDFVELELLTDDDHPQLDSRRVREYELRVAELERAIAKGFDPDRIRIRIADESRRLARLLGRKPARHRTWHID